MRTTGICGLLLAASLTTPAFAQQCAPYPMIAAMLTKEHGESVVGRGLAGDGSALFELWLNPQTGTWSALIVRPGANLGCPLASGKDMEFARPIVPGRDG